MENCETDDDMEVSLDLRKLLNVPLFHNYPPDLPRQTKEGGGRSSLCLVTVIYRLLNKIE